MADWQNIFAALREDGINCSQNVSPQGVGGGDISAAWRVDTADGAVFVKTANADSLGMLEGEAEGLRELGSANAIRVPGVLAVGATDEQAYLVTEWLELARPNSEAEGKLGQQLADMHRHCGERFGWHRDNSIGRTPQHNQWSDNWLEFFRERRLRFQLELAKRNGFGGELQAGGTILKESLGSLFRDHEPSASLLHGDLWGGNWAATQGQPVVFDPAVYYGDRESDIAMTKLFGGFGPGFYSAYQESWPMEPGYEDRLRLYQLYYVLNHLNLFGRSYLGKAINLIGELNRRISC
jgi:fructosamine-3-kinase